MANRHRNKSDNHSTRTVEEKRAAIPNMLADVAAEIEHWRTEFPELAPYDQVWAAVTRALAYRDAGDIDAEVIAIMDISLVLRARLVELGAVGKDSGDLVADAVKNASKPATAAPAPANVVQIASPRARFLRTRVTRR